MWQREMARALPVIAGARPPPLKGEAFFGRTPVKGAPQGGELAELARPEGLCYTSRSRPLPPDLKHKKIAPIRLRLRMGAWGIGLCEEESCSRITVAAP